VADRQKRTISGPGASDFLTAQGGEDLPETSTDKGTDIGREASPIVDARNLEIAVPDDDEVPKGERTIYTPTDEKGGKQG
jgi:hypothetical protein